jgi:hypothetical protein
MTHNPRAKLPLPVEVTGLEFLSSPAAPRHAVLEFQTTENPVRLFLTLAQILELMTKAHRAAAKIEPMP